VNDPVLVITIAMIVSIVVVAICVLAYFVPGLVLRAIRDFKTRYDEKGEAKCQKDGRRD